jgi:hypothetical protein
VTEPQRPAEDATPSTLEAPTQPVPPDSATAPTPAPPAATSIPTAVPPAAASIPTAVPLASVIAKPKSSTGRGTSLLMGLAAAIAIGGIAFAAGRLTAPAAEATTGGGTGQARGAGQFGGNGQGFPGRGDGFGGISLKGTVSAVSADSLTLKLASGTEVTIPLSSSTTYHTAAASSADAVTVGSEVSVTPGARVADPNATPDPNASPGPGAGRISFGAATDVTVTGP